MSAKKSVKTPKDKLIGLLACGSSKKNRPLSNTENAPEEKPEEEGPVDHSTVNVRAYKGHDYIQKPQPKNAGEFENEEGLVELSYCDLKLIGKGTFGVVYRARLCESGELVAIKKVFDDRRYKNRELVFMRRLQHPNICDLKFYFYSEDPGCRVVHKGERFLNMVLEFVPKTLFTIAKCDGTFTKPFLDPAYIKVYIYQLLRSLNYLHSMNICHRDIKPQNMLINPSTHEVKLCDFGSAKELLKNESNVSYICSRYYRAPELIFGTKDYTCQIDLWSAGCIMGELYLGHPIFPGASGPDQMVEIMKIIGTPTYEDIKSINHNCANMVFPPTLVPMPWNKVFTKVVPSPEAINLMSQLLVFNPQRRIHSLEALAHAFFQEIKNRNFTLPDGKEPPHLFDFTSEELENSPTMNEVLQPLGVERNEEDERYGNLQRTPLSAGNENFKSKIINLARNSFRKASFRKDKYEKGSTEFNVQNPYHFEESDAGLDDYGRRDYDHERGGEEVDADFADDIQNLQLGGTDRRDVEESEEGEKKKKKKKKKSKSHQHGDEDDTEMPMREQDLERNVAFDGEESAVRGVKKKKKKKVDKDESHERSNEDIAEVGNETPEVYGEEGRRKAKKKKVKEYEEESEEITTYKTSSSSRRIKKHLDMEEEARERDGEYAIEETEKKKKKKKKVANHHLEDDV